MPKPQSPTATENDGDKEQFIPDFTDSINKELPPLEDRKEEESGVPRYQAPSETEEQVE